MVSYTQDDDETFSAPDELRRRASFDRAVRGRFDVCPLGPPRRGAMQAVCVDAFSPSRR